MIRGKLSAMNKLLRQTNPARLWLREKFQTDLQLASGHHIVVRFDLPSTGVTGYRFDAEAVISLCGEHILADIDKDYGEYLNVASTIADVLNQKVDAEAKRVLGEVRMSLSLLDALDAEDWMGAALILEGLTDSLICHGEHANRIWGSWVNLAVEYVNR